MIMIIIVIVIHIYIYTYNILVNLTIDALFVNMFVFFVSLHPGLPQMRARGGVSEPRRAETTRTHIHMYIYIYIYIYLYIYIYIYIDIHTYI